MSVNQLVRELKENQEDYEFMKALNVEAGRLLGWLSSPEQAKEEFTAEMAKGIEKYFKSQYDCLSVSNQLLLGTLQK